MGITGARDNTDGLLALAASARIEQDTDVLDGTVYSGRGRRSCSRRLGFPVRYANASGRASTSSFPRRAWLDHAVCSTITIFFFAAVMS